MNTDTIQSLTETFEGHAQQTDGGIEYWLARDLQHLLGYAEWRNWGKRTKRKKSYAKLESGSQYGLGGC